VRRKFMSRNWKSRLALITGAAVLVSAGVAFADMSLRQKEFAKKQDEYFKKEVDLANEKCGIKLNAKIDWESFKGEVDKQLDGKDGYNYSFSGYCDAPVGSMFGICDSEDGKAAIKKRIKSYTCKYGGEGKRKIELKGANLTMWVDWKASNYDDYVKEYLGKTL
jgi:hypothetical protein